MIKTRKTWRKRVVIGFGILIGLLVLLMFCLSPILKYIVEKNDEKWIGRQITVGWVYANPLTGYVHLHDVKFYEHKSDSVCLTIDGISGHFNLIKLLSKQYLITDLTLIRPSGTVIQYTKERFNFSDIVDKFAQKSDKEPKNRSVTKFSLMDIKIEDGTFYLKEIMTPVNYFVKDVNITSTGIQWDVDTIANTFDFNTGIGTGKFQGDITFNKKTALYRSHVIIRRLDLKIIEQYLKAISKNTKFKALMNFDITANGSLKDGRDINAVGGVGIYDFHVGSTDTNDVASFKKFVIKIDHLNPRKGIYEIDSMSLVEPFAKYERYDHLDNIQYLIGEKGSNVKAAANSQKFNLIIAIADYIKLLTKNFFHSNYKVNRVGIYGGNLQYGDYTLNEKFSAGVGSLNITADSLGSDKYRARMKLSSSIKPYGNLNLNLSIDPKDSSNFELNYHLQKINAAAMNPYITAFTSFPLDRGSIELQGNWLVRNGEINSTNHILILDPRVAKHVKTGNNKWLPLKLVMFFVRESGNVIDYDIPITGNLKNPKFHLKDVFVDVLSNIFIKPATTVYRYKIKSIENTIEKSISFNWEPGSTNLSGNQEKFADRIAEFLKDNPEASIAISPHNYNEKEEEFIGFYEAKKKYFLITNKRSKQDFSEKDSMEVIRLSPKDSLFNRYMRHHLKDSALYTTQQLCRNFVGVALISKKYNELNEARKKIFLTYFKEAEVINRLKFQQAENVIPYNGFSFYRISYHGSVPESVKEAYEELCQYDNESPRKKFKNKRRKTRKF